MDDAGTHLISFKAASNIDIIQTFHLSVNLVDLYLSKTNASVPRKNLQAIGSVCMYVASKME